MDQKTEACSRDRDRRSIRLCTQQAINTPVHTHAVLPSPGLALTPCTQ